MSDPRKINPQAILDHLRREREPAPELLDELLERLDSLPPEKLKALKAAIDRAEKRK